MYIALKKGMIKERERERERERRILKIIFHISP